MGMREVFQNAQPEGTETDVRREKLSGQTFENEVALTTESTKDMIH